ncbi:Adenylate and Guanylate cyclase catalytic domain containing protein [Trichomonas vaginalis G3]|uniref:Adenylate and Guanylate cyclase catalytic domain containing protein n=1 Tax=Trichomonas vaginalis (strain ATCC PRA-98 / G3) TaxID=412133 RepID=A2EC33_TRIV3|nr:Adenylate and Guanylate cyclase catalytic domain containing protein [Trichomonas vaginalis G3]|eukprot:XP_001322031.1 Adenylate and Guanylate cyclase catalytic domain containing protein [Trichomonas vaginalis G3]
MSGINKYGTTIKGVGITCILVAMILMFMAVALIHKEDILLTFTMRLLLFCPPRVVLSNSRIMDLIAGDYENKDADQSAKHLAYSNEVVNKLNDSIIVIQDDESNKIININTAFEETFNVKSEDLIGKSAKEFFTNERFQGKVESATTTITNLQFEKDGNTVFMEFTPVVVNTTKIISGRDKTQNILHEQLIEEERKKSDTMLASILPASLVPRVQAGEKNISFSVQSVTVLFFDVVEFTPWCGSHDAQYVMRMLNIVFKEMDAITNAHKTMTKIKCIGDCYMAAGGIFDEVNQPQIHAREVVDFGCLAIKKLLEIDDKENENLKIRVGINTGGPIVAGVIGTEKPTFEILGPAINIAHEMEHHGVPMKVHISRPVYEFIYGGQFSIKERGEIEVKGGKMFTYLVDP